MQYPDWLDWDAPRAELPRVLQQAPAPEWHAASWRPAGSMSLSERWLRAGEVRSDQVPPKLKRRR
jgi:hypothetical protein